MNRLLSASSLATLLILFSTTPSQAQFSWKPQPLPSCRTFAITEIGIWYSLTSPSRIRETYTSTDSAGTSVRIWEARGSGRVYGTSDLGLMRNMSQNYSLGGSLFLGLDSDFKTGMRFRVRRWLSDATSIDFSPGVIVWDDDDYHKAPGFTGSIDLKIREWFGLAMTCEYSPPDQKETRGSSDSYTYHSKREPSRNGAEIYIGLRSGSYPGLAAHGVAAVVGVAVLGFLIWHAAATPQ